MKTEMLQDALGQIRDDYILDAHGGPAVRKKPGSAGARWLPACAFLRRLLRQGCCTRPRRRISHRSTRWTTGNRPMIRRNLPLRSLRRQL